MQTQYIDRRIDDPMSASRNGDRSAVETSSPNEQALANLLDKLETRISIVDEKRERSDKDVKMRREWMLAAAVIDRLCFIVLIIVFTVGTIVFVVLFLAA